MERKPFFFSLCLSLGLYSFTAFAEYSIFSSSFIEEDIVNIEDRSNLIANAALMAKASYNGKNYDQRRLELIQSLGCDLIQFESHDPVKKISFPAGIVCLRGFNDSKTEILIAFHGTESSADWMTNVFAYKKSAASLGLPGYAHGGFLDRYQLSRESVQDIVQEILDRLSWDGIPQDKVTLVITGHSLGGALATLAAADLQNSRPNLKIFLVLFASPRVLDRDAANFMETRFGDSIFRIWRGWDPVSKVSFGTSIYGLGSMTGFKHEGQEYSLNAQGWSPLINHSMVEFAREATSSEKIIPSLNHKGFWNGRFSQSIKNWFSRK